MAKNLSSKILIESPAGFKLSSEVARSYNEVKRPFCHYEETLKSGCYSPRSVIDFDAFAQLACFAIIRPYALYTSVNFDFTFREYKTFDLSFDSDFAKRAQDIIVSAIKGYSKSDSFDGNKVSRMLFANKDAKTTTYYAHNAKTINFLLRATAYGYSSVLEQDFVRDAHNLGAAAKFRVNTGVAFLALAHLIKLPTYSLEENAEALFERCGAKGFEFTQKDKADDELNYFIPGMPDFRAKGNAATLDNVTDECLNVNSINAFFPTFYNEKDCYQMGRDVVGHLLCLGTYKNEDGRTNTKPLLRLSSLCDLATIAFIDPLSLAHSFRVSSAVNDDKFYTFKHEEFHGRSFACFAGNVIRNTLVAAFNDSYKVINARSQKDNLPTWEHFCSFSGSDWKLLIGKINEAFSRIKSCFASAESRYSGYFYNSFNPERFDANIACALSVITAILFKLRGLPYDGASDESLSSNESLNSEDICRPVGFIPAMPVLKDVPAESLSAEEKAQESTPEQAKLETNTKGVNGALIMAMLYKAKANSPTIQQSLALAATNGTITPKEVLSSRVLGVYEPSLGKFAVDFADAADCIKYAISVVYKELSIEDLKPLYTSLDALYSHQASDTAPVYVLTRSRLGGGAKTRPAYLVPAERAKQEMAAHLNKINDCVLRFATYYEFDTQKMTKLVARQFTEWAKRIDSACFPTTPKGYDIGEHQKEILTKHLIRVNRPKADTYEQFRACKVRRNEPYAYKTNLHDAVSFSRNSEVNLGYSMALLGASKNPLLYHFGNKGPMLNINNFVEALGRSIKHFNDKYISYVVTDHAKEVLLKYAITCPRAGEVRFAPLNEVIGQLLNQLGVSCTIWGVLAAAQNGRATLNIDASIMAFFRAVHALLTIFIYDDYWSYDNKEQVFNPYKFTSRPTKPKAA